MKLENMAEGSGGDQPIGDRESRLWPRRPGSPLQPPGPPSLRSAPPNPGSALSATLSEQSVEPAEQFDQPDQTEEVVRERRASRRSIPFDRSQQRLERRRGGVSGGESSGNGGRGANRPPERPRGPEGPRSPEWGVSPEWGSYLCDQIIEMETTLPYEVRYDRENGSRLNRLYADLIKYVIENRQQNRSSRASFTPAEAYSKVISEIQKNDRNSSGENYTPTSLGLAIVKAFKERAAKDIELKGKVDQTSPEDFTGVDINYLSVLNTKDKDNSITPTERAEVRKDLLKYFREAHRKGLLKGVDETINAVWLQYRAGRISVSQARELLQERIIVSTKNDNPTAYITAEAAYRRKRSDNEVHPRLLQVWEPYLRWAGDRFEGLLDRDTMPDPEKGEWSPPTEQGNRQIKETFWEPFAGYPDYYTITAKTPAQFIIAKETFLQMLKNHALGYDPNELMTNLMNFKKVFSRDATTLAEAQKDQPEGPDKMTPEFAKAIRQEFEGEGFLWGAFYNGEHYNREGHKQYMTAMALHEGPERWIRVLRSRRGKVGVHTWNLDNDLMVQLYHSAQGSRGQLGKFSQVQEYLKTHIKKKMLEKGMGVVLKDYHPDDPLYTDIPSTYDSAGLRLNRALILDQIVYQLGIHGNLELLSEADKEIYLNSEKSLKENQERIGVHQSDEAFKNLYEGFDKGDAHIRNYLRFGDPNKYSQEQLPSSLTYSVRLGRIQHNLRRFREQIDKDVRNGNDPLRRYWQEDLILKKQAKKEAIDLLVDLKVIDKSDKEFYESELAKEEAGFDVAYEMQGATQEATIKGGSVYFIYRNPYVQAYQEVRQSNIKDESGNDISDNKLSPEQRLARGPNARWTEDQHIGWILEEIKLGTRLDSFSPKEKELFEGLNPEDKVNIVDHMPAHLAIKGVQAVVNWTKMKYADDAEIWKRADLAAKINEKDSSGHFKNPDFRAVYRTAMVEENQDRAIYQIKFYGYAAKFYDLEYQVIGFDPKTKKLDIKPMINSRTKEEDVKPMMLKRPRVVIDSVTGKTRIEGTEEVHLDLDTAVKSYLALHTTHTYWAYQNTNTQTLSPDYVFGLARDIKDGKVRPEDVDIFAGLLLTLDPTLCRVKGFNGEQMTLEATIFDAAVEDSFLSWVDIKKALNEQFLPGDGNLENMNTGYYTEDKGGEARQALQLEALVAKMPKRWARRFAAALSLSPIYVSSMADNLGRSGVIGAVSIMEDKIADLTGQRILGQFGITKFINVVDSGSVLWFTLVGGTDPKTGDHHEGVFTKPTNNNDKLMVFWEKMNQATSRFDNESEFLYELKETFGRVNDTLHKIRTMYSDNRNSGGALDLRKTDVFLPNGRFNPEISTDNNTGSSRHIAEMFWYAYVDWLLDAGPGGGVETYGESAYFYKFLKQPYFTFNGKKRVDDPKKTWAKWLFDKMAL